MPFEQSDNPQEFGTSSRLELFALEYLKDLHAINAAVRAGYAESTARSHAYEMLRHPKVQEHLAREIGKRKADVGVEATFVLRELIALASVDLAAAYDDNGNLKPIHEIPVEVRKAIAGIEVCEEFAGRGEEREHIGNTRKVKLWDRLKALELLGRHLALFNDKLDVNLKGDLAARILQARKRGGSAEPGSDLV